jgi:3-phosphoshikimate 1-carboxyvinyltransferase
MIIIPFQAYLDDPMKVFIVSKHSLSGACYLPASKSQSIRAILFAGMAKGISEIDNTLPSPDISAMVLACRQLGAEIQYNDTKLVITGVDGCPSTPDDVINAGNSGQVLRFIACLAGLQNHYMVISGDDSIRHNRPVKPLLEALPPLGVQCQSLRNDDYAPLILKGPFSGHATQLDGADSQPVSGLLMAAAFREGVTSIQVRDPGEKPWVDLTLQWLHRFNIPYQNKNFQSYQVTGKATINGFKYRVPGDLSALSFLLVAALITQSEIVVHDVDMSEPQGDKAIVAVLQQMGANISYSESEHTISVYRSEELQGIAININDFIDCIAILAVLACFSSGVTRITGAAIAREKESDRIKAISSELAKMGADISELPDGLIIKQSALYGASVDSYNDHRIAMSLAVAAMASEGETTIARISCVDKSFPGFATVMQSLGAQIKSVDAL